MRYPRRYVVTQTAKAIIRAAEILAAAFGFLLGYPAAVAVAFALMLVNEVTEFAPLRGAVGLFFKGLEGTVRPRGDLKTRLNKNLAGSVTPTGKLIAAKAPRTLEYKGFVAIIAIDRPGNGFRGSVPGTDIRFRANLVQDIQQSFEDAVEFHLELKEAP